MLINYNGDLLPVDHAFLDSQNRAFRYGDGLFETIRMFDGSLPFWPQHWDRLSKGAQFLKFKNLKDPAFYKKEIQKLCHAKGNWRIRLSIFRKDGGLYTPSSFETDFLIEANPLESQTFELNKEGLHIDLCDSITIPKHPLSNLKTINSLPYVIAGIYKKEKQLDDCLLLNDKGKIVEASSSNIFIVKKGTLRTPPLSTGCKDGTLRRILIELSSKIGLQISQKSFKPKRLLEAEEIWLSNAITGILWVGRYRGKTFDNTFAKKMLEILELERML